MKNSIEKFSSPRTEEQRVIEGFGDEWVRFPQTAMLEGERNRIFKDYFYIFPWHLITQNAVGADIGCGSGRWALEVAPRVKMLHVLDGSEYALGVAKKNLNGLNNVYFHHATVDKLSIKDESLDFAYSLGVLHHLTDTESGIKAVAKKLKQGAPFLIYLYYAFDNRPVWYRFIWKASNIMRLVVSRLPFFLRYFVSQILALFVYWPFARFARFIDYLGIESSFFPLTYYKDKSVYTMRTDALDRFGTLIESRFTKKQIVTMMENAGFREIIFSNNAPYWCASGIKQV